MGKNFKKNKLFRLASVEKYKNHKFIFIKRMHCHTWIHGKKDRLVACQCTECHQHTWINFRSLGRTIRYMD